jgi:hypothetical protein
LQAYTVELEAELNQLREENSQLKQALVLPNNMNYYRTLIVFSFSDSIILTKIVILLFFRPNSIGEEDNR